MHACKRPLAFLKDEVYQFHINSAEKCLRMRGAQEKMAWNLNAKL
jgi:hypothetical protein